MFVDGSRALATGHVVAAFSALAVGAAVLPLPKGTHTHRAIGTIYVIALIVVDAAALALHRENVFGVFHALAVVSLITIAAGITPLLLGRRSPAAIAMHAYCMTWSYAGLAAAGCGQLAVAVGQDVGAWLVPVAIGAVLSISGVLIFGKVPPILDRMVAER